MPGPENTEAPTFSRPNKPREHVPGRILVQFDPEAMAEAAAVPSRATARAKLESLPASVDEPLAFLRRNAGLQSVEAVFAPTRLAQHKPADRDRLAAIASVRDADEVGAGATVLDLPDAKITKPLLKRIAASPAVKLVERLPARWLFAAPDPKANLQWGLPAVRYFQAGRPAARRIKVGVLDSGIDTSHPDLPSPALYRSGSFSSRDLIGHGTHVAGVIAALTNNGVGVTGICDCELGIWKIFPDDDEYVDPLTYYRALGEIVSEKIDVVNLSIGGTFHSKYEAGLFADAIKQGVTVVAAMGNEFEKGNPTSYPAAYDDVISVGAIDEARRRSRFSNTGKHIDICAPGSNILSTLPTRKAPGRPETNYASWSGTSMATPHVTAAAALVKAKKSGRTPAQIANRLSSSAAKIPEMRNASWTEAHGNGLLDLKAALT
jgi:hypothetical protein